MLLVIQTVSTSTERTTHTIGLKARAMQSQTLTSFTLTSLKILRIFFCRFFTSNSRLGRELRLLNYLRLMVLLHKNRFKLKVFVIQGYLDIIGYKTLILLVTLILIYILVYLIKVQKNSVKSLFLLYINRVIKTDN